MSGYYFKYKSLHLQRVWAKDEESAKQQALKDHKWCGVECESELTLIRINSTTAFSC